MATFLLLPSPTCASSSLSNKESYRFCCSLGSIHSRKSREFRVRAVREKTEEIKTPSKTSSPEDVTKKYGLEAGLWKVPVFFLIFNFMFVSCYVLVSYLFFLL